MAEDSDFGDFSSAFQTNRRTGDTSENNANFVDSTVNDAFVSSSLNATTPLPDVLFDPFGAHPNDVFGDFSDISTNPIPRFSFVAASLPDNPRLPEDIDLHFDGVENAISAQCASFSNSPIDIQSKNSEPVAGNTSAVSDSVEFGGFEFSFASSESLTGNWTQPVDLTVTVAVASDKSKSIVSVNDCADLKEGNCRKDDKKEPCSLNSLSAQTLHKLPPHSFGKPVTNSTSHAPDDGFADFSSFQTDTSNSNQLGAFASQSQENAYIQPSLPKEQEDEFESFSIADNECEEFKAAVIVESETTRHNSPTDMAEFQSFNRPTVCSEIRKSMDDEEDVFWLCFSCINMNGSKDDPVVKLDPNNPYLDFRFWAALKSSVDFTVPLYKWDASHLQQFYYGSIKVDTMLVEKVDTISLNAMIISGGSSAAVDLIESFGFEEGLQPTLNDSCNSTMNIFNGFQRSSDDSGPALLDLSLPLTPSAESQNDSFKLDADLLSVDLNPTQSEGKLTSIEQLLLNEKLVVNRTTWMDSELMALGGGEIVGFLPSNSPPTSADRRTTLEQQLEQLGLDTSKTTLGSSSVTEISISTRLTYDRLPDLCFMTSDTIVKNVPYWKC